jgi:hypothetical protein
LQGVVTEVADLYQAATHVYVLFLPAGKQVTSQNATAAVNATDTNIVTAVLAILAIPAQDDMLMHGNNG